MLYDKILLPIDGSTHSILALQEAIRIVKTVGGDITAVYLSARNPRRIIFRYDQVGFSLGQCQPRRDKNAACPVLVIQ